MTPTSPHITVSRSARGRRILGDQSGHTLIELMSAVSIVLILLGNAVPSFSNMLASYGLQGASRRVVADFQRARMAAVTENNRYIVRLIGPPTHTGHDDGNNNGASDAG